MSFSENFILVMMKKDSDIKYVSQEQVNEYLRNGWKEYGFEDLGGKDD